MFRNNTEITYTNRTALHPRHVMFNMLGNLIRSVVFFYTGPDLSGRQSIFRYPLSYLDGDPFEVFLTY